jgi:hypothetical protein
MAARSALCSIKFYLVEFAKPVNLSNVSPPSPTTDIWPNAPAYLYDYVAVKGPPEAVKEAIIYGTGNKNQKVEQTGISPFDPDNINGFFALWTMPNPIPNMPRLPLIAKWTQVGWAAVGWTEIKYDIKDSDKPRLPQRLQDYVNWLAPAHKGWIPAQLTLIKPI